MSAPERRLTDRNGQLVHAFSLEAANLGLNRLAELIIAMLDSDAWRDWRDGLGEVHLLPGEFDYFLSMTGVTRDAVMHGVRDINTKARLEQAMDERRAGEEGYRRRYDELIAELGRRKAEPFGYTQKEAKFLVTDSGSDGASTHREALGSRVRRYSSNDGKTTKAPSDQRARWERLAASVCRLPDDELAQVTDIIRAELAKRKAQARRSK
jgi:hypothetical protein